MDVILQLLLKIESSEPLYFSGELTSSLDSIDELPDVLGPSSTPPHATMTTPTSTLAAPRV